jgi:hypothetical protein
LQRKLFTNLTHYETNYHGPSISFDDRSCLSQTAKTAAESGFTPAPPRENLSKAPGAKAKFGTPRWPPTRTKQIAAAFEKKYPGVSVDTYRTGSSALTQRLLTEAKARRHIADAIENHARRHDDISRCPDTVALYISAPGRVSRRRQERASKYRLWTTVRESYVGFGYNKNW